MILRRKLIDRTVQNRDAPLYLVIVEGAETEPRYFYALEENNLVPRHHVKRQAPCLLARRERQRADLPDRKGG